LQSKANDLEQESDTRGSSSTSHNLLTSKILRGNEQKRFTKSNLIDLISKSEAKQMMFSDDNELEEKKTSETTGEIAISSIKFISQ
jgi:hypothetical protein